MNKRLAALPLFCLLLAALIFAGCDSGTPATPTEAPETPGINITQADYDAALAKWKALNVQEYNIVVDYSAFALTAGTWDLNVTHSAIKPNSFQRGGTPTPPPAVDNQALFLLTVDGLFNEVSRALQSQQSDETYLFRYEIQFDPDKGYPTHFSARNVPNPTTGNQVADADFSIIVKSLTVVK